MTVMVIVMMVVRVDVWRGGDEGGAGGDGGYGNGGV